MIEDETFQRIVDTLLKDKKITQMVMFGSPGLRIAGKVFTFLWKGHLVLKLPGARVQQLIDSGDAKLFDPGHGRGAKSGFRSGRVGSASGPAWPKRQGNSSPASLQEKGAGQPHGGRSRNRWRSGQGILDRLVGSHRASTLPDRGERVAQLFSHFRDG